MVYFGLMFAAWGLFVVLLYKTNKEQFSLSTAIMPLMVLSVLTTMDLSFNATAAANPAINDGITVRGVLSPLIFSSDNWSLDVFNRYFNMSLVLSLIVLLIFTVSLILAAKQKANKNTQ